MATHADSTSTASATAALTPARGLVVLVVVALAVGAFIAINAAFGLEAFFGGFLFVFYFMGLCHVAPDKFVPAAMGAYAGMAIAFALVALPATYGSAGMAAALAVVLLAVYALIMGWAPVAINNATMLFLTVGTIPALQQTGTIAEMALSATLAIVLVGAALLVMRARTSRTS